jgi:hypothetical protein
MLNRSRTKDIASALRKGMLEGLTFADTHAIANMGATSIFVMVGTPMSNIRPALDPLTINLLNGKSVHSMHICNISIPGLPMIPTGHIVSSLSMASLMGIHILCKAGCKVIFTDTTCEVKYQDKVILTDIKDPTTDLWTLPITPTAITATRSQELGHDQHDQENPPPVNWVAFAHSFQTHANAVKFSHQSLCNQKISSLMKALKKGFLNGCPNLSKELVTKYLNPSPATAKGHMKRPKKGICSTRTKPLPTMMRNPRQLAVTSLPQQPIAQANLPILPLFNNVPPYSGPAYHATIGPNIIADDEFIANVFCFGAFANKITGVVYNNLTGNFPFMSLDGSVCFFVLYHYKTNSILATPITNLDDKSIFTAYTANFKM